MTSDKLNRRVCTAIGCGNNLFSFILDFILFNLFGWSSRLYFFLAAPRALKMRPVFLKQKSNSQLSCRLLLFFEFSFPSIMDGRKGYNNPFPLKLPYDECSLVFMPYASYTIIFRQKSQHLLVWGYSKFTVFLA